MHLRLGKAAVGGEQGLTTSFGLSLGFASLGLLGLDLPPALDFLVGPPIAASGSLAGCWNVVECVLCSWPSLWGPSWVYCILAGSTACKQHLEVEQLAAEQANNFRWAAKSKFGFASEHA